MIALHYYLVTSFYSVPGILLLESFYSSYFRRRYGPQELTLTKQGGPLSTVIDLRKTKQSYPTPLTTTVDQPSPVPKTICMVSYILSRMCF